ncbi:MAG: DUF4262 domain-containing protein [Pseudomonadales bacterium]|nr:DUF4262 domain-containing protein [Pseudomonadales bacterium]
MARTKIEADIEEHGWHGVHVFDEKSEKEDFSYTIGLEKTWDHPEVIIFGLARDVSHQLLWSVVEDIKAQGAVKQKSRVPGVLAGDYEVIFLPVRKTAYADYFGTALGYYNQEFRALVMLWPDKDNVLPTEAGCQVTVQREALGIIDGV